MTHKYYSNPLEKAVYSAEGPQPQELFAQGAVRVIVAGLEAGQKIPEHPEGLSTFHFMAGKGVMTVDGERMEVGPGVVIIADHGALRGMQAETRLAFIAVRITDLAR